MAQSRAVRPSERGDMEFFLPCADDLKIAEENYNAIKKFAEQQTFFEVTEKRIFSLRYEHEGRRHYAEVGKVHGRIGELVIAILESKSLSGQTVFLICSPNRCVLRGEPMLVGEDEVRELNRFGS